MKPALLSSALVRTVGELAYSPESSRGRVLVRTEAGAALEPLLCRWAVMLGDERGWCIEPKGFHDAPWWYNEQATLSHLAGAAWCDGRIALQEYIAVKKAAGTKSSGRADLWISRDLGKPGSYVFEAKQSWPRLAHVHDDAARARSRLDVAGDDARKNHRADTRVGLCLIAPHLTAQRLDRLATTSRELLQSLDDTCDPDFIVAAWRRRARVPASSKGVHYPGLIAIGRVLDGRTTGISR